MGAIFPDPANILSSTNTTPIQITVDAPIFQGGPAGVSSGLLVSIVDHQTNTNANGVRTYTTISPTVATLDGSVGNGSGVATGRAIIGVDRVTGVAKFSGRVAWSFSDAAASPWASNGSCPAGQWSALTTAASLSRIALLEDGNFEASVTSNPFIASGIDAHDVIRVRLKCLAGSTQALTRIGLFYAMTVPGASSPGFGAYSQVPGASSWLVSGATQDVSIDAWISSTGTSGVLYLTVGAYPTTGPSAASVSVGGDTVLTLECFRNPPLAGWPLPQ